MADIKQLSKTPEIVQNGDHPAAPPVITKEQIALYNKRRAEECSQMIEKVLTEFDCELRPMPYVTDDGRIAVKFAIAAK